MSKAQKSKPRLGRGLSSLISTGSFETDDPPVTLQDRKSVDLSVAAILPTDDTTAVAKDRPLNQPESSLSDGLTLLPVNLVVPNPHQPRRQFDDASLADLAASLKSTGMIQPVIVRPCADGYELVAGERRWRAAKLAGLVAIPAVIRQIDGFTQAQMALVENIQREDLNPIDRALGYRALIDQLGLTQAELAGRLGEDRSSIANFLRLLELYEPVREMLRKGDLTTGHAKLLAGLSDPSEQLKYANLVVSQTLSVRNLEQLLSKHPLVPRSSAPPSAHLSDLAQSLTRQLQMPVELRAKAGKGKGKLIIHYGSLDQFDDLLSRLGVQADK